MGLSAAFLAMLGVGITFLPQELLAHVGAPSDGTVVLLIQMLGALYFGFRCPQLDESRKSHWRNLLPPSLNGQLLHGRNWRYPAGEMGCHSPVRDRSCRHGIDVLSICGLVWIGSIYRFRVAHMILFVAPSLPTDEHIS
jgi:hypothetical protein